MIWWPGSGEEDSRFGGIWVAIEGKIQEVDKKITTKAQRTQRDGTLVNAEDADKK